MTGSAQDAGIRARLADYQKAIDLEINDYAEQLLARTAAEYTPYSHDALNSYVTILRRGGKRLRGAMGMAGYRLAGGDDEYLARRIALVLELIHAYLLVIDDIADRSQTRRGGPSAHKIIETDHRNRQLHGDSVYFGESIAMHAGLLGGHVAMQELCALPADDSLKLEAMSLLNQVIARTVHGQFNDIYNEAAGTVSEQEVLDTLTWKTASYTIVNPLQMGTILAGADAVDAAPLDDFGEKLGLAFQITDDIIGTFGLEDETGKSSRDDMAEGKMTLMVVRALQRGSDEQKAAIQVALGNHDASDAQFEAFRAAIEDSGALHYCRGMVGDLVGRSVRSLDELPLEWRQRDEWQFLRGLAGYIRDRTN